jgi:hypothetical protein
MVNFSGSKEKKGNTSSNGETVKQRDRQMKIKTNRQTNRLTDR